MAKLPLTQFGYPEMFRVRCFKPKGFVTRDGVGHLHDCGKCEPCLERFRLDWARRFCAERDAHAAAGRGTCFLTLTLSDDGFEVHGRQINDEAVRRFVFDLRRLLKPLQFRFAMVAELGALRGRLHYHGLLFGLDQRQARAAVKACWPYGRSQCDDLTGTGAYVAKYIGKGGLKWFYKSPGLGRECYAAMAAQPQMAEFVKATGDVPVYLEKRSGGGVVSRQVLPRYARRKVREAHGLPDRMNAPLDVVGREWKEEEVGKLLRLSQRVGKHGPKVVASAVDEAGAERIVYYGKNPRSRWRGKAPVDDGELLSEAGFARGEHE